MNLEIMDTSDSTAIYWISNVYIPISLEIIVLTFSIYIGVYSGRHLYKDQNWLLKPAPCIKFLAIFVPFMLGLISILGIIFQSLLRIAYIQNDLIPARLDLFASEQLSYFPKIYTTISHIRSAMFLAIYVYAPMGYILVK